MSRKTPTNPFGYKAARQNSSDRLSSANLANTETANTGATSTTKSRLHPFSNLKPIAETPTAHHAVPRPSRLPPIIPAAQKQENPILERPESAKIIATEEIIEATEERKKHEVIRLQHVAGKVSTKIESVDEFIADIKETEKTEYRQHGNIYLYRMGSIKHFFALSGKKDWTPEDFIKLESLIDELESSIDKNSAKREIREMWFEHNSNDFFTNTEKNFLPPSELPPVNETCIINGLINFCKSKKFENLDQIFNVVDKAKEDLSLPYSVRIAAELSKIFTKQDDQFNFLVQYFKKYIPDSSKELSSYLSENINFLYSHDDLLIPLLKAMRQQDLDLEFNDLISISSDNVLSKKIAKTLLDEKIFTSNEIFKSISRLTNVDLYLYCLHFLQEQKELPPLSLIDVKDKLHSRYQKIAALSYKPIQQYITTTAFDKLINRGVIRSSEQKLDLSMGDILSFYETKSGDLATNIREFTKIITDDFRLFLRKGFIAQQYYDEDDYQALNSLYEGELNYIQINSLLKEFSPLLEEAKLELFHIKEEVSKIFKPLEEKDNRNKEEEEQFQLFKDYFRFHDALLDFFDKITEKTPYSSRRIGILDALEIICDCAKKTKIEAIKIFDQKFYQNTLSAALLLDAIKKTDADKAVFINPAILVKILSNSNEMTKYFFKYYETESLSEYDKLNLLDRIQAPILQKILLKAVAHSIINNAAPWLFNNKNLIDFHNQYTKIEEILKSKKPIQQKITAITDLAKSEEHKIDAVKTSIADENPTLENFLIKILPIENFQAKYELLKNWLTNKTLIQNTDIVEFSKKILIAFQDYDAKSQAEIVGFLFLLNQEKTGPEEIKNKLAIFVSQQEISFEQAAYFAKKLISKNDLLDFCFKVYEEDFDRLCFIKEYFAINSFALESADEELIREFIKKSSDISQKISTLLELNSTAKEGHPPIMTKPLLLEIIKKEIAPKNTVILCKDCLKQEYLLPSKKIGAVNPEMTLDEFFIYGFITQNEKFISDHGQKCQFLSYFKSDDLVLEQLKTPAKFLLENFPNQEEFKQQKQYLQSFLQFIEEKTKQIPEQEKKEEGQRKSPNTNPKITCDADAIAASQDLASDGKGAYKR